MNQKNWWQIRKIITLSRKKNKENVPISFFCEKCAIFPENIEKTVDIVPEVWYDNNNEREQRRETGERVQSEWFPHDMLFKVWGFPLGKRIYIKKEGEIRWQMKSHSCICCQRRIEHRLHKDKSVARVQHRLSEGTKVMIKNDGFKELVRADRLIIRG